MRRYPVLLVVWSSISSSSCGGTPVQQIGTRSPDGIERTTVSEALPPPAPRGERRYGTLKRPDFNRLAVRQNLPLYWRADDDGDGSVDPAEVAGLMFYPSPGEWVKDGAFTPAFEAAYDRLTQAASSRPSDPESEETRRRFFVTKDLDQGRATLVESDLTGLSVQDKRFVAHMLKVADLVDDLYELQNGAAAMATRVAADPESRSLFRRNRGPKCVAPATEKQPECSAIPGAPKPVFGVYPAELQQQDKFCKQLETHKDAKALLDPFTVVRSEAGGLTAVPYTEAYATEMRAISDELHAAANAIRDPAENPLAFYLRDAARSFLSNDWKPADEAWAQMNVDNSKWYVRIAPDEVYWEPCAAKAGFHLSFARINQSSRTWQQKLVPIQQEMELRIAKAAGAPYRARKVTFHLPDFIDLVVNAGDDRDALGATIGQSLPNWGPVANEGRGRTVAMVNLYTDPDSLAARRGQAESMLDRSSMGSYVGTTEPGLLNTILHEATHNLGPAHEYAVGGKKAPDVFGGPLASVMEELKAQTGGLYLIELLREKGIISDDMARQTYTDAIVWALGHVSQGMYTATGERKAYSNLAAMQIGFLLDAKALTWDVNAPAANGSDKGALIVHLDKLPGAIADMTRVVAGIKARGDRKAAEDMSKKYVDDSAVVPHDVIQERFQRFPKSSFVYAVRL